MRDSLLVMVILISGMYLMFGYWDPYLDLTGINKLPKTSRNWPKGHYVARASVHVAPSGPIQTCKFPEHILPAWNLRRKKRAVPPQPERPRRQMRRVQDTERQTVGASMVTNIMVPYS